jgi:hypothetical protein
MSISKDMREWNNFNRPPVTYYLDIVKKLLPVNHPNYLSELGIALNHLLTLSFIPSADMIEQINDLFTRLLQEAARSNDYSTIGNVLSDYGKVPQIFRKKASFILPPPKEPVDFNESNRTLKITVSLSEWTLAQTARFTNLLSQLENNLSGKSRFGVNYIEHGSLIIQLAGHVQQLFGALRMLVDLKKTKVEIDSIEIESSKKLLELRKLEIDLTHYESMKEMELEKAKVDLEKTKIDVAKTKLEFLNAAQQQFGFDYVKFNRSLKGKESKKIADIIQKEFPVISLKLE